MKTCFVIMPFGGEDERRQRFFLGVYQGLIVPAAERAGYRVHRSDLGGGPGNITADIVQDLADADIVIADLTEGNANVLFELGIRHALRKSGTIHIVDKSRPIPFDVGQYRAVKYSTDLADIPAAIEEISKAIAQREQNPGRSDNPVHDTIPGLPADYRMLGQEAALQQLVDLQSDLDSIRRERDILDKKLGELDPIGHVRGKSGSAEPDVDSLFDQADEVMRSTGDYVLLRLKEAAEEGGRDAFVAELRSVIKSPYLSVNDLLGLARMCVDLNLEDHRRATLEVAYQRFPQTDSVLLGLVDAYDDSPVPAVQERGRIMLEQFLGIERAGDGKLHIADVKPPLNISAFGILFNLYFTAAQADWVLQVCDSVLKVVPTESLFLRNRARALADLLDSRADQAFADILAQNPLEAVTYTWYAGHLNNQRRFTEAYKAAEMAVIVDPEASACYINLAIEMFNNGLVRQSSGEIAKVGTAAALRAAIPLLITAIETGTIATRQLVVNMMVRRGALREARALAKRETPQGRYNVEPLEYIRNIIADRENAEGGLLDALPIGAE